MPYCSPLNIAQRICDIEAALTAILATSGGLVILHRVGYNPVYYQPTSDTNEGRMAALQQALEAATLTPSAPSLVLLVQGNFAIPSGIPLTTYATAGNVKIAFNGVDSAVVYAQPTDARADSLLYRGARNVQNFGAVPNGPDCLAAFTSVLYSFPGLGGVDNVDEFGRDIGAGFADIPDGWYYFSDVFYIQAFQQWKKTNERVVLFFMANIAPLAAGVHKRAFGVARSYVSSAGGYYSNFTHDVGISGLTFTLDPTGNELLGAFMWAGAQNSFCTEITINGPFASGLTTREFSANTDFNNFHIIGVTGRAGPGFSLYHTHLCQLRNITVTAFNPYGTYLDTDGRYMPGFKFDSCRNNTAIGLMAESCPRALWIISSFCNTFTNLWGNVDRNAVSAGAPPGITADSTAITADSDTVTADTGGGPAPTILVDITSGTSNVFLSLLAVDHNILVIEDWDTILFANAPGEAVGNYYQSAHHFRAVELIENGFIDFRRRAGISGAQLFRWQLGQWLENPALTLVASDTDGDGNELQLVNFAGYNVDQFNIHLRDAYCYGPVNTDEDFRVNQIQVVTDRDTGWAAMTGTASKATFATYSAPVISAGYVQAEVQALADQVQALSRRLMAVDTLLLSHGLIGP